jgi:prepilin-type N-terminal cleavage/methylation domain-containing protein
VSPDSRLKNKAAPRRAAGFTLIEVMVVLLIVALITATILAAFERVLDVRLRVVNFLDSTGSPALVASWFRDSINGLVADTENIQDNKFSGSAKRLSGLTLVPMAGMPGVPRHLIWEIAYDPNQNRTSLRYQLGDQPQLAVASWPGDRGSLQYCDTDLSCYDDWPPKTNHIVNVAHTQLPALVRLDLVFGTQPWPILAAPRTDPDPQAMHMPF